MSEIPKKRLSSDKFNMNYFSAHHLAALIISLSLFLTSCHREMISAYTDYFTVENLSSFYVDTPDPRLNCPPFGQRLFIEWLIPLELFIPEKTYIDLTIRYRDRTEEKKFIPLRKYRGTYMLCLTGEQYCAHCGILTYKILLKQEDCILKEWRHQLWAELIIFEEPDPDTIPSLDDETDEADCEEAGEVWDSIEFDEQDGQDVQGQE